MEAKLRWTIFDNLGREIGVTEGETAEEAIEAARRLGYKDASIAQKIEDLEELEDQWHITGRNF